MIKDIKGEEEMRVFGSKIGAILRGGEVIELVGDVGAGKTTIAKGIAAGLGVKDNLQSPSFTINRLYDGSNGVNLSHYDFYRLNEAGIMNEELLESLDDNKTVTIIEWSGLVSDFLPVDRLSINISATDENTRHLVVSAGGGNSQKLLDKVTI